MLGTVIDNIYTEHTKHEYTMESIVQCCWGRMEQKGRDLTYIYKSKEDNEQAWTYHM